MPLNYPKKQKKTKSHTKCDYYLTLPLLLKLLHFM